MASPDSVATVAELRAYLGLTVTDDDAKIERHRAAAIDLIESYTRRNVLDREVSVEACGSAASDLVFYVADVQVSGSATVSYRADGAGPGFSTTASLTVPLDRVRVVPEKTTLRPDADGWPGREDGTFYSSTFSTGMTEIPPAIQEATRLIVRELYEGSAMDAIPMGSLVSTLLGPYTRTLAPGARAFSEIEQGR